MKKQEIAQWLLLAVIVFYLIGVKIDVVNLHDAWKGNFWATDTMSNELAEIYGRLKKLEERPEVGALRLVQQQLRALQVKVEETEDAR